MTLRARMASMLSVSEKRSSSTALAVSTACPRRMHLLARWTPRTPPSGDWTSSCSKLRATRTSGSSPRRCEHEEAALGSAQLDDVVHDDLEEPIEVELAVQRLRDAMQALQAVALRLLGSRRSSPCRSRSLSAASSGASGGGAFSNQIRACPTPISVAGLEARTVDQVAVQPGPVLAAEVHEDELVAVVPLDPAVVPGGPQVQDGDVVVLGAPEVQDLLVEVPDGATEVLVEDEPGHVSAFRLPGRL